jgi:dipeptidase E
MKIQKQIVALGGAGFTAEPYNPALELYLLEQTRKSNPSICFIMTATGDAATNLAKFYATFAKRKCRVTHLPFFERTPNLRELILSQDLIYVGGGNTKSMLAVWREWGLPDLLRQAWNKGTVLAGISAGAICWFETGITDSWAENLKPLPCLGWLANGCCPHYDSEADRRPTVLDLVGKGLAPATLALDDGAAAHFIGHKLARVVTWRPKAGAYLVERKGKEAVEKALDVTYLNKTKRG